MRAVVFYILTVVGYNLVIIIYLLVPTIRQVELRSSFTMEVVTLR